jgi:hypothetical protein
MDLLQPYCNPSAWGIFEGSGGVVLHVEEDVRVGVEGDGYGGVAKEFLRRSWVSSGIFC